MCELGRGLYIPNFEHMAMFVEATLSGCSYLLIAHDSAVPLAQGRSDNVSSGRAEVIRLALVHAHGPDHGQDAEHIAQSLQWVDYPL
jgi:hypothetical protein